MWRGMFNVLMEIEMDYDEDDMRLFAVSICSTVTTERDTLETLRGPYKAQ